MWELSWGPPAAGPVLSPSSCACQQSNCQQGWDQTRRGENGLLCTGPAAGSSPQLWGGPLPDWGGDPDPRLLPVVELSSANPCLHCCSEEPGPVPSLVQPGTKRRRELDSEDEDDGSSGEFSPSALSWGAAEALSLRCSGHHWDLGTGRCWVPVDLALAPLPHPWCWGGRGVPPLPAPPGQGGSAPLPPPTHRCRASPLLPGGRGATAPGEAEAHPPCGGGGGGLRGSPCPALPVPRPWTVFWVFCRF